MFVYADDISQCPTRATPVKKRKKRKSLDTPLEVKCVCYLSMNLKSCHQTVSYLTGIPSYSCGTFVVINHSWRRIGCLLVILYNVRERCEGKKQGERMTVRREVLSSRASCSAKTMAQLDLLSVIFNCCVVPRDHTLQFLIPYAIQSMAHIR